MAVSKQPSDASVRQQAVNPQRSYLVQAPAGSGKTELLTDRILALLATVARPEEVVAITFTKKAAAEMHARVLEKLQRADAPRPEESYKQQSWELARAARARDAELGWGLLQYPARLSIRTIDSLCAHLVRAMPWASGLGGVPAITDDAQRHYDQAALATLNLIESEVAVEQLMRHLDVNVGFAQELIAGMLASRDQWQPALSDIEALGQLEEHLQALVESRLQALVAQMPYGWSQALAPALSTAAEHCVSAANKSSEVVAVLSGWDGTALQPSVVDLPRWHAVAELLLTQSGGIRKRITVAQGFPPKSAHKEVVEQWLATQSDDEAWVTALHAARSLPSGYTGDQLDVLFSFIHVLWLASAQLRLGFSQHSEVDFTEIAQRALAALGNAAEPTELLLKVDRSIRHLLVDEFQDTSHLQLQLLERITSGWEVGDGRTVFLVGDPMQSIYRFRKAEVGLFLQVKNQAALGAVPLESLSLTNNFRSTAGIVEWVNRAGPVLFSTESDPEMGAVSYNASIAFQEHGAHTAFSYHPICVTDQEDTELMRAQRAVLSQDKIVELCTAALERHSGSAHPVAILVRARSHLRQVVRELAQHNVPCRAVELEPLYQRMVIRDLEQLIRALHHPADRLAWLAVLRSPLVGLTLNTLHQLCAADATATIPSLLRDFLRDEQAMRLDASEAERLRHAASVLLDNRNHSGMLPFAAWVERIWRKLGGQQVYAEASDLADAEQVFRLLEKIAAFGELSLSELQTRIQALYAVPRTADVAVEVMTIHKAKGLEFESVILYGLERMAARDTAPLIRLEHSEGRLLLGPVKEHGSEDHDPISQFLAERDRQRSMHEMNRLLYVALTRARSELHIVADIVLDEAGQPKPPASTSLLNRIWACLDHSVGYNAATQLDVPIASSARQLKRIKQVAGVPQHWHWPSTTTSPWQWPSTTTSPWQWPVSTLDERAMGTVAHAWLEKIAREGVEQWPTEQLSQQRLAMRTQLLRAGINPEAVKEYVEVLLETLTATVSTERGRWLLMVAKAYREWSLLDISGRVSVIDLAIEQSDHWLIVDYKTGAPQQGESLETFGARMRGRYAEQMQRYCEYVYELDKREAKAALYFPRVDLWVSYDEAEQPDFTSLPPASQGSLF